MCSSRPACHLMPTFAPRFRSTPATDGCDPNPVVTGGLGAICSQSLKLVKCYAGSGATSGATFIHGYNGGGSGGPRLANPIVRQVELGPAGCDPQLDLSAPYFFNRAARAVKWANC